MYRWESFWLIRPVITPADTALAIAVLTEAISMTTALGQRCNAVITSSPVTSGGAATITVPGSSASLRTRPAPISSATPCADGEGSLSNTSMPAARSPKTIEAPNSPVPIIKAGWRIVWCLEIDSVAAANDAVSTISVREKRGVVIIPPSPSSDRPLESLTDEQSPDADRLRQWGHGPPEQAVVLGNQQPSSDGGRHDFGQYG